jgi:hypothetical protein
VHLVPFVCLKKLEAKPAKLVQKFVSRSHFGIFATNAPNPPHWTLNSCFGMFHTILMHLGPFGWLAKLGGKWAELMQKFVPRSRVRMFRNERTRSSPLDPKLMVWCVSYYLVHLGPFFALQHSVQNGSTGAKVRATKSRCNFSQRTHPIQPIGP